MKVRVTGGAGYIGSHTCKALAAAGHEVLVYDNLSTEFRNLVKWGEFIRGDILDGEKLRACLRKHKPGESSILRPSPRWGSRSAIRASISITMWAERWAL